jgi:thioredoxin 2
MIRACASCGAPNRVPAQRLADRGRCGACKAPLPPIAEPIEADSSTFDEIVNGAKVPVLVDFWASWCGPCRRVAPEVEQLAGEVAGQALVLKVDTERNPDLAARFAIRSIPNFVVFRQGRRVAQKAGAVDRRTLRSYLESAA